MESEVLLMRSTSKREMEEEEAKSMETVGAYARTAARRALFQMRKVDRVT